MMMTKTKHQVIIIPSSSSSSSSLLWVIMTMLVLSMMSTTTTRSVDAFSRVTLPSSSSFPSSSSSTSSLLLTSLSPSSSKNRLSSNNYFHHKHIMTTTKTTTTTTTKLFSSFQNYNFGVDVAQKVHPSVVLVTPIGVRNSTSRGTGFVIDMDELFYYLIPKNKNKNNNSTSTTTTTTTTTTTISSSSFDNDNDDNDEIYIVTAAHVAAPGWDIQVSMPHGDDTNYNNNNNNNLDGCSAAVVVGRDLDLDLALLRVASSSSSSKQSPLQVAGGLKLYNGNRNDDDKDSKGTIILPSPPKVGTLSFAHGYPASRIRGPTMTMGIVCGIADGLGVPDDTTTTTNSSNDNNDNKQTKTSSSSSSSQKTMTTFIVTDAAMAGGMSGGPLTDIDGRVMGVTALIRPDLRALGNYAVSVMELRSFLSKMAVKLQQEQEQKKNNDNSKDTTTTRPGGEDATTTTKTTSSSSYNVVLFNDRFNKKERVSNILQQSLANLTDEAANKVMMEAHTTGRGVVQTFSNVKDAQKLWSELRQQDVLVEIEQQEEEQ